MPIRGRVVPEHAKVRDRTESIFCKLKQRQLSSPLSIRRGGNQAGAMQGAEIPECNASRAQSSCYTVGQVRRCTVHADTEAVAAKACLVLQVCSRPKCWLWIVHCFGHWPCHASGSWLQAVGELVWTRRRLQDVVSGVLTWSGDGSVVADVPRLCKAERASTSAMQSRDCDTVVTAPCGC